MSNTKQAMRSRNIKYFSSLTARQKCRTIKNIRAMRKGIFNLSEGLVDAILKQEDLDNVITEVKKVSQFLEGGKCFKHNGNWYPLGIKDIIN